MQDIGMQFHIRCKEGDVGKYCFLPGDPGRCEAIARFFDDPVHVGMNREYNIYTGTLLGEKVILTPTEFRILKLLMENAGKVLSPKKIYEEVWNADPWGAENTVAVHVRHLREKIEIDPASPRYLKVVWGQGYKLEGGREA